MKTKYRRIYDALAVTLVAVALVWGITLLFSVHAQQPTAAPVATGTLHVENGKLEPRNTDSSLSDMVNRWAASTTKAEWLGYSAAEVKGDRSVCCGNGDRNHWNNCGPCSLESRNYSESISSHDSDNATKVNLEGPHELAVLYRAESGKTNEDSYLLGRMQGGRRRPQRSLATERKIFRQCQPAGKFRTRN